MHLLRPLNAFPKQWWLTKLQSGGREFLMKNHPYGPGEERGGLGFNLQDSATVKCGVTSCSTFHRANEGQFPADLCAAFLKHTITTYAIPFVFPEHSYVPCLFI